MNRKQLFVLIGVIVFGLLAGCMLQYSQSDYRKECTRQLFAMDTFMTFTAYGKNSEEAVEAAVQEVMRLDALLSTGKEDSEISRINEKGSGKISEDTKEILKKAEEIYEETGGAFDITIYPLMQLWGFSTGSYHVPSEAERTECLSLVNGSSVAVSDDQVLLKEGQKIDLGGIAKGYTSGRVMEVFKEYGIVSGMVSLGGNVQTLGTKPDGSDWHIGIQDPDESRGNAKAAVAVRDRAVITSGGYERYFEENGETYIHILDPKTGLPADSGLVSVTVVSEDGMLADALSTSLYIMGKEQAYAYWKDHSSEFEMILLEEDGTLSATEGLRDCLQSEKEIQYLLR